MLIQETYVDTDRHSILGESELFEPFTSNIGPLFIALAKEYGRCVNKIYIENGKRKAVGWVFSKRVKYEDSNDTYIQEVWVTLHKSQTTIIKTCHYMGIE